MKFKRFLTADEFISELRPLYAFGDSYIGQALLEDLEQHGLVIPIRRLFYPEKIARRVWYERQEASAVMKGELEPDGADWDAAVDLENAIFRWENRTVCTDTRHPFDNLDARFRNFVSSPKGLPFRKWDEFRVDVSNNIHQDLLDASTTKSYYAPWQILAAAEAAKVGVFIRLNVCDSQIATKGWNDCIEKRRPGTGFQFNNAACAVLPKFVSFQSTLDAIVQAEEDAEFALLEIAATKQGRFRLTADENDRYNKSRLAASQAAIAAFGVSKDDTYLLAQFLIERWIDWNRLGRPLISDAYKSCAAATIRLLQSAFGVLLETLRVDLGPEIDRVWPDWFVAENQRLSLTLRAAFGKNEVHDEALEAFCRFLMEHNLESLLWRLRSFEEHVFRGNEFAASGMRSDLQGMAIAVEHVARALGGTGDQLYKLFASLWVRNPAVANLLKLHRPVAMKGVQNTTWSEISREIQKIRTTGGLAEQVVADLLMAQRIRGAVHYNFAEEDNFEVEKLLVGLVRAAFFTFVEVNGHPNQKLTCDTQPA